MNTISRTKRDIDMDRILLYYLTLALDQTIRQPPEASFSHHKYQQLFREQS